MRKSSRHAILPSDSGRSGFWSLVSAKETLLKASTWLGGGNFEFGDVPDPEIGPDDVMVRIGTVGVCGTDVHITQGLFPAEPPQILGHEASGEIIDVGENVNRERIGENVVLNHTTSCGECDGCQHPADSRRPGHCAVHRRCHGKSILWTDRNGGNSDS